jgi:hypothetical protein
VIAPVAADESQLSHRPFGDLPVNQHKRIVRTILGVLAAIAMIGFSAPAHAGINCSVSMTNIPFSNIDVLPGTAIDLTAPA